MRWGAKQVGLLAGFLAGSLAACGGNTERGGDDPLPDSGVPDSGPVTTGSGGTQPIPDAAPDVPDAGSDAPMDVVSDYVDPGCPDAEPPPPIAECDPFASPTGCEAGLACYPFVERPGGDGCDFERFGAICMPPGQVQAGERCGASYGWCDAGLLCVVGALSGARCLQLCDPFGPETCSGGLVCSPVDVEGYGVCG